ncbi:hypothetical protein CERSUDRAFT_89000 [Gelatoporia subvermispora B]|uniref:Uncharacterized protein n=1 Tax=Ceriporiopsis subvermispora (strain B) TaxID=914234 RepID=M2QY79_CERS8|nr:hypothetical protein CERSUDRAFT_89000 [Gelatoporia subvermispora B]
MGISDTQAVVRSQIQALAGLQVADTGLPVSATLCQPSAGDYMRPKVASGPERAISRVSVKNNCIVGYVVNLERLKGSEIGATAASKAKGPEIQVATQFLSPLQHRKYSETRGVHTVQRRAR